MASLSKASPPSQASRLRCLISIVRNLDENQEQFVYKVIPEAILCVKATNEKARSGSFTLLVVIGEVRYSRLKFKTFGFKLNYIRYHLNLAQLLTDQLIPVFVLFLLLDGIH